MRLIDARAERGAPDLLGQGGLARLAFADEAVALGAIGGGPVDRFAFGLGSLGGKVGGGAPRPGRIPRRASPRPA
jgi:hypothetical protein